MFDSEEDESMPGGNVPEGMQRMTIDIGKDVHQILRTEVYERGNAGERTTISALIREALDHVFLGKKKLKLISAKKVA